MAKVHRREGQGSSCKFWHCVELPRGVEGGLLEGGKESDYSTVLSHGHHVWIWRKCSPAPAPAPALASAPAPAFAPDPAPDACN